MSFNSTIDYPPTSKPDKNVSELSRVAENRGLNYGKSVPMVLMADSESGG